MMGEVHKLVVEGAKYAAAGDLAGAARCYARALELETAEGGGDGSADHYLLFGGCLYQLGLEKGDMFAGAGDEEEEDDDDDEEDEPQDAGPVDSRLYQFDQAEEDKTVEEEEEEEEEGQDESEPVQEDEESEGEGEAQSFESYMEGDLFYNALEILLAALSRYQSITNVDKNKIAQTMDLVGDVYQELEEFDNAIAHYKEALQIYQSLNDEKSITKAYSKLAEAIRWTAQEGVSKDNLDLVQSAITHLQSKVESESDKLQLQQLQQDMQEYTSKKRKLPSSAEADMVKQLVMQKLMGFDTASESSESKSTNDLSTLVKKKSKKKK